MVNINQIESALITRRAIGMSICFTLVYEGKLRQRELLMVLEQFDALKRFMATTSHSEPVFAAGFCS
jgi:hypothetical protein